MMNSSLIDKAPLWVGRSGARHPSQVVTPRHKRSSCESVDESLRCVHGRPVGGRFGEAQSGHRGGTKPSREHCLYMCRYMQLLGRLQKHYGIAKDQAEKQVKEWGSTL